MTSDPSTRGRRPPAGSRHTADARQQRTDQQRRSLERSTNERSRRRDVGSIVASARTALEDLLGQRIDRVSAVAPDGNGWRLSVDVVELERVPDSTSVLGCYEVMLGEDGDIVEYERVRRYYRNRTDEGDL